MSTNRQHGSERFIYFTGVDGCGKSTVIDELIKEYGRKGISARRVWLRFNYFLTRPVLLFCRLTGLTRREKKGDKIFSIHDFYKSAAIATLVQYLHFIDTALAYLFRVWIPLKFSDDVILCDKFVYDILADFMVESRDMHLLDKAITRLFLALIPENAPVIFFGVDREEIIKRKPEVLVDDEDYDLKYRVYQEIMNRFHPLVIRNDVLEDTVLQVKSILNL
jgi:thymidylate kinase